MTDINPLITKYRPASLDEVIGQDDVVEQLAKAIEDGLAQSFLFSGPAGTGKTTLSRIVGDMLGVPFGDQIELDAASVSGVDGIRELTRGSKFYGRGTAGGRKHYTIDECHRLSTPAIEALLKTLEEPSSHLSWGLCTTHAEKLPKSVWTRLTKVQLRPVDDEVLYDYGKSIIRAEKLGINRAVLEFAIENASGSPRELLSHLSMLKGVRDVRKAAKAIAVVSNDDPEVVAICQDIIRGRPSWDRFREMLRSKSDSEAEGVRRVILAYFTSVALSPKKSGSPSDPVLNVISCFSLPVESRGQLILAFDQLVR